MSTGWLHLLRHNTKVFLKDSLAVYWLKFKKECPACQGKNLHYVEGSKKSFEKWFCRDCMALHYRVRCLHCDKWLWQVRRYKSHILKEYQLGKYKRNKSTWWKEVNLDYIKENIALHKAHLIHWRKTLASFRKKPKRIIYGGK